MMNCCEIKMARAFYYVIITTSNYVTIDYIPYTVNSASM